MTIDVMIEDAGWADIDLEKLAQASLDATLVHVGLSNVVAEVSILACDDQRIAALNGDFRDKSTPTNVLSWPSEELGAEQAGLHPSAPRPGPDGVYALGDVAIAFETCTREAADLAKPVTEHVTHLLVHGILHLLGYDHIRDKDAVLMQDAERKILGKLGIDDPY